MTELPDVTRQHEDLDTSPWERSTKKGKRVQGKKYLDYGIYHVAITNMHLARDLKYVATHSC